MFIDTRVSPILSPSPLGKGLECGAKLLTALSVTTEQLTTDH